jgi:uncharacterized protein YaiE (UPF0345 family)
VIEMILIEIGLYGAAAYFFGTAATEIMKLL